jgi:hypothetical protein
MKYALFEFVDEDAEDSGSSIEIGESSWIADLDEEYRCNEKFDFEASDVEVMWRSRGKKPQLYTAKVLKFSGIDNEYVFNKYPKCILIESIIVHYMCMH